MASHSDEERTLLETETRINSKAPSWVRWTLSTLMAAQFVGFALLRSHVRVDDCDSAILLWGEVIKMAVSVAFVASGQNYTQLVHNIPVAIVPTL